MYCSHKYFHFLDLENCSLSVPEKNNKDDPRFLLNYYENREFIIPDTVPLNCNDEISAQSPTNLYIKVRWAKSVVLFRSSCGEVFRDKIKFSGLIRFPQFLSLDYQISREITKFINTLSNSKKEAGKSTFGCEQSPDLKEALFLAA